MAKEEHAEEPAIFKQSAAKEIRIALPTIEINFDHRFRKKAPLLAILLVVFLFSCIVFDKANFRVMNLMDFTRIADAPYKLFSLSSLLFIALYSLLLAFTMFYSKGLNKAMALFALPVTLVPAIALGLFMPAMLFPFIGLSIAVGATAFLTSRERTVNWKTAWKIARRALMLLLIGAVLTSYLKVAAAPADYTHILLTSTEVKLKESPQFQTLFQGSSSNPITEGVINQIISDEAIEDALSEEHIAEIMGASTEFNALPDSAKSTIITQLQPKAKTVIKEELKQIATQEAQGVTDLSTLPSGMLEYYFESSGFDQTLHQWLPFAVVPIVWIIASIYLFIIRGLTTLIWFGLSKL
jgi:hypothetical protein